jgi:dTDP-glucose 4,6-dehydratase
MKQDLTGKTVLLTGGAGFIGSCAVGMLVQRGARVIVLDALTYAGFEENLRWIDSAGYMGSYELVRGSITDGALVASLLESHRPDAVLNFAAESHVDNSIAAPSDFIQTNIIGTYTMLEAARAYWNQLEAAAKAAFRFVQISTDEVYGSLGLEGKFHEEYPMQPNSPYSASKAAGDHLARAWFHTYGLPTIVTNCTNNYGARQFPEKLIPHMIFCALEGKPLPIYGDGENIRDWIHVEDHANGVLLALMQGREGETYCFGGNAEKTNLEVVHSICDLLDAMRPKAGGASYRTQMTFVQDRAGHDRRYAIDDSKAVRELGFTRVHSFESGMRQTVEWYLANHAWCAAVKAA